MISQPIAGTAVRLINMCEGDTDTLNSELAANTHKSLTV